MTLRRADSLSVTGPESERAERYLRAIAASFRFPKAHALAVEETIQPHAGLGSGTQLALAVGAAFAALGGLRLDPQDIAVRLGRGTRSGIGIATFGLGGAVLDGGPREDVPPQLIARLPFPSAWRVLLILDADYSGLAGTNERAAFEALPHFPESESEALRRRIIERAVPALAKDDFKTFCDEIENLQACMGRYYAPVQGGAFASPRVGKVLKWLRDKALTGLGQSSWGPTGFAFVASEREGKALLEEAEGRYSAPGLSLMLVQGNNEGAKIETD